MDILLIILGFLGTSAAVVMTIVSAVTFRKPRKIRIITTLLSGIIAGLSLLVMVLLGGLHLNPLLAWPLLLAGMLLGFLRGQAVRLEWDGPAVIGRSSLVFLILWGFSLALSHLLGMIGSPLLASLGLIPAAFSTGLQLGFYSNTFLRRASMRRAPAGQPPNENDPAAGLHTLIGIGGGLALSAVLLVTLVFTIPALIRTFPDLTVYTAAADQGTDLQFPDETLPQPTPSPTPGYLPQSGSLTINCEAEMQRKLEQEEPLGGNESQQYTFDEIFSEYKSEMIMRVDLYARRFNYYFLEFYTKWDLSYDPSSDEDRCWLYIYQTTNAEGRIAEDGWFSGGSQLSRLRDTCTEDTVRDDLESTFFGFIDDDTASIVYCPMPLPDNPLDFEVDMETLREQGKDRLIQNWWDPQACSTCTIEEILP